MSGELKRISEEVVVACFWVRSWYWTRMAEENNEKSGQPAFLVTRVWEIKTRDW